MVVSVVSADQFLTDKHSALNWNWGNTDEIKKALNDVISDPVTHRGSQNNESPSPLKHNGVNQEFCPASRFTFSFCTALTPQAAGSLLHGFA